MPIYEYICSTCGNAFEKQLHFNDNISQIPCPNGHKQTKRQISKPIIVFKGSGFYINDSRKSTNPQKNN